MSTRERNVSRARRVVAAIHRNVDALYRHGDTDRFRARQRRLWDVGQATRTMNALTKAVMRGDEAEVSEYLAGAIVR